MTRAEAERIVESVSDKVDRAYARGEGDRREIDSAWRRSSASDLRRLGVISESEARRFEAAMDLIEEGVSEAVHARGHLRARAAGHRVADFNTLDDLIAHAGAEGATHASGDGTQTKLYFPRGGQYKYEEATVWRKESYWHAQGPGARTGVSRLPSDARSIGGMGGRRAAEGRSIAAHRDPVDEQAATELVMFIENESDLSPDGPQGQGQSVRMNALRKWRNGTYDSTLGVKLFEYLAESGAKRYAKEFGSSPKEWNTMFNPATRHEAAKQLEASFRSSAENGEYDHQAVREVRDYEAVDNRDRHIAGPFKSYGDARQAAGTAGVVKFVPSRGKPSRATEVRAPQHHSDVSAAIESWNRGDAYRDGSLRTLISAGLVANGRGGWAPTASGLRRGMGADHLSHTGPREVRSTRSAHHPIGRARRR
jgi:hypothetical protein